MSEPFIPYGRQWVDEDDIQAVVDVLKSDYLTTGPAVSDFEEAISAYTGVRHAVVVSSGTAALHAAYFAAGLEEGQEIITSPLTFCATANAALYLGASIRFVDVQPDTGNMDPEGLESVIRDRTRLIVPVDYAGHPADYDEIEGIAHRHGLLTVADAAHSLGATYKERPVGTLADITEVSFHPVKPITSGEGGAVLTDEEAYSERARRFRSHGIEREPQRMRRREGPWYHEQVDLGYNYRLTDVQAALGASQMKKLSAFLARRRQIADMYAQSLADREDIQLPAQRDYVRSGWHLYVIRLREAKRRRAVFERMRELGLGVQVHYIPTYLHPYYEGLGYPKGLCPNAEAFYGSAISLPIFPRMADVEVESTIDRVKQALSEVA